MIISAIVHTATPATETPDMILIAFRDFFAKRYLLAIYKGSLTYSCFLALTNNPVPVSCVKLRSKRLSINETGNMIR